MSTRSPLLWSVLVLSCEAESDLDLPAIEFETERTLVGIAHEESRPLCRGDLDKLDTQVASAEDMLGVVRPEPVEIYLYRLFEVPCPDPDTVACYRPDIDAVLASWRSVPHEIVHAVAREIRFPSLVWSEGTAELLTGKRTYKDDLTQLDSDYLARDRIPNYVTAAHFSRFLVETRGWEAWRRAIRGESPESIYGETLDKLTEAYEQDAPFSYPALEPCPYPPLPELGDGVWQETLQLSCDAPGTTQFEFEGGSGISDVSVLRTVELQAGRYALELSGGRMLYALRCQMDVLEAPIEDPFADDIRIEGYGVPNEFAPGQQHVVTVSAGTYELSVASGTIEDSTAELTITRLD